MKLRPDNTTGDPGVRLDARQEEQAVQEEQEAAQENQHAQQAVQENQQVQQATQNNEPGLRRDPDRENPDQATLDQTSVQEGPQEPVNSLIHSSDVGRRNSDRQQDSQSDPGQ